MRVLYEVDDDPPKTFKSIYFKASKFYNQRQTTVKPFVYFVLVRLELEQVISLTLLEIPR